MGTHNKYASKHIKPLCSPQPNKKKGKTNQDSKTFDVMRLGGRRDRVTVRIKRELKEALKKFCDASGLSICHISEGLYTGYLVGVGERLNLDAKSPTINLTLVRDVKRVRRYARASRDFGEVETTIDDHGSVEKCYVCSERPCFVGFRSNRDTTTRVFGCEKHFQKSDFEGWRSLW